MTLTGAEVLAVNAAGEYTPIMIDLPKTNDLDTHLSDVYNRQTDCRYKI